MGMGKPKRTIECEPVRFTPRCRKHRYATHAEACRGRHGIKRFNKEQRDRRRHVLDIYWCTTCDGWHIGHRPKKARRR